MSFKARGSGNYASSCRYRARTFLLLAVLETCIFPLVFTSCVRVHRNNINVTNTNATTHIVRLDLTVHYLNVVDYTKIARVG